MPKPQHSRYAFSCEAEPVYMPDQSDPGQGVYTFAYTITVRNVGEVAAQLIARHWTVVDGLGRTEEVKGLGVVGQQPLLRPGEAFQYTSGTRLRTATGVMRGNYFCVAEDGERFEADIPAFVLDATGTAPPDGGFRQLH